MDSSAVKELQDSGPAKKTVDKFCEKHDSAILVPKDYKIEHIEHLLEKPKRHKSRFNTNHISHFAKYVQKQFQDIGTCFINKQLFTAICFLEVGSKSEPSHRENLATVTLEKTADYQSMLDHQELNLNQLSLANFINDFSSQIICISQEGETINNPDAIRAIQNVKIDREHNSESTQQTFQVKKSNLESMSVNNELPIPAIIEFSCIPYSELSERNFASRLTVNITGNTLVLLTLKRIKPETHDEKMIENFEQVLAQKLPEKIETHIGTLS